MYRSVLGSDGRPIVASGHHGQPHVQVESAHELKRRPNAAKCPAVASCAARSAVFEAVFIGVRQRGGIVGASAVPSLYAELPSSGGASMIVRLGELHLARCLGWCRFLRSVWSCHRSVACAAGDSQRAQRRLANKQGRYL